MQLIRETAIVSHIKDEYAYLIIQKNSACGSCASKSSCSNSALQEIKPKSNNILRVSNDLSLQEGDTVILGLKPNKLLLATVLMYILPLVVFIVFAAVAKVLGGERASIAAGLAGFFLGLFILKKFIKQPHVARQFQPKILSKVV